jgi:CubicO group peptidase (beta-lactamase class C family)
MEAEHIPGVVTGFVKDGGLHWVRAYGWANIEERIPISADTLQNIGSISKTFTTTALMQLWEEGLFNLDDDVSQYLPFEIRHTLNPETEITFRHLLTHYSALRDGSAYAAHYKCGDPSLSLEKWVKEYLLPGGSLYNAQENFEEWAPGERWRYCNVAYGLLAYLTEVISKVPFEEYCQEHVFKPLGMMATSWYLRSINSSDHAIPYTWIEGGEARGPSWGGLPLGVVGGGQDANNQDGFQANCLYNHPNFPDGFLRTSIHQISNYLLTYLGGGTRNGYRLLKPETINEQLLAEQCRGVEGERIQGLTWYSDDKLGEEQIWGHRGSDPGINTDLRMVPSLGIGAIVFTNTNGSTPGEITRHILEEHHKSGGHQ